MVTGGNCTGSRVPEKMMHSKSGELQSDQMFPMVTVPLDTLLKMTEMHTHEKLMETWRLGGLCSCNFKTPLRVIGTKGTFQSVKTEGRGRKMDHRIKRHIESQPPHVCMGVIDVVSKWWNYWSSH